MLLRGGPKNAERSPAKLLLDTEPQSLTFSLELNLIRHFDVPLLVSGQYQNQRSHGSIDCHPI